MIPAYMFYSLFGAQRMIDLIWAAGDTLCKGFLFGGIAGKTTLAGEGLQHQGGHSHHTFLSVPPLMSYDPAFAYELAVIVRDGIYRMYHKQENIFYYITMMNENYNMPPMPDGCEQGILKGLYKFQESQLSDSQNKVNLMGSGTILTEVIKAQQTLESEYGIAADIWSITSYKELYTDAVSTERWNFLHPADTPRKSHIQQCFEGENGVFVAASDYMKALPCSISQWIPGRLITLGTDGYGRSDTRRDLREYFEVNSRYIVLAALRGLVQEGKLSVDLLTSAMAKMDINPEKVNPMFV